MGTADGAAKARAVLTGLVQSRREATVEWLRLFGPISTPQLAKDLKVSERTIRRDIAALGDRVRVTRGAHNSPGVEAT